MRVLIADRDEVYLEVLQSYLWDRGFEAEVSASGVECMTILRHFVPDVLIIERDLPWGGSDGILAEMQDDPVLSEISVILIGDAHHEFEDTTGYPIASRVEKPFRLSELPERIACARRPKHSVKAVVRAK